MSKKQQQLTVENYIQKAQYDDAGQMIWAVNEKEGMQLLLNVRGWGNIQHLFEDRKKAAKFQDKIGQWITDAINEKLTKREPKEQGQKEERQKVIDAWEALPEGNHSADRVAYWLQETMAPVIIELRLKQQDNEQ